MTDRLYRAACRCAPAGRAGLVLPALMLAGCAGGAQPPAETVRAHAAAEAAPVLVSFAEAPATALPGSAAAEFGPAPEAETEAEPAPAAAAPATRPLLFDTGRAQVQPGDLDLIKTLAGYLAERPALRLRITGHADPRGSAGFNQTLSERRAREVERLLIAHGAPAEQLVVAARGAEQPLAGDHRASRRVELDYVEETFTAAR